VGSEQCLQSSSERWDVGLVNLHHIISHRPWSPTYLGWPEGLSLSWQLCQMTIGRECSCHGPYNNVSPLPNSPCWTQTFSLTYVLSNARALAELLPLPDLVLSAIWRVTIPVAHRPWARCACTFHESWSSQIFTYWFRQKSLWQCIYLSYTWSLWT
jgi:hypothetical protein